ncbi:hypothetical protein OIU74_003375 [Salix koriyanagi]|uniref:Uncharacterized protein n=1 Tax=Salix koriyanagi TaxID=2511006 RepID=A0A9Q0ZL30_9ROSI|nr:hypothetical protein OIU74_003375 [Salix koriyanagi]
MQDNVILALQLRGRANGVAIVVKNAKVARNIATFSNTLDGPGNFLLISCEERRETKGKVSVVLEMFLGQGEERFVPVFLVIGIQDQWKKREAVSVMGQMVEEVVETFLGPWY